MEKLKIINKISFIGIVFSITMIMNMVFGLTFSEKKKNNTNGNFDFQKENDSGNYLKNKNDVIQINHYSIAQIKK